MQSIHPMPEPHAVVPLPHWRTSGRRLAGWTVEILADLVRGPATPAVDEQAPAVPPVRYRHPVRGCTWYGRGLQPQWLRDAVLQEGYLLHQLRCGGLLLS